MGNFLIKTTLAAVLAISATTLRAQAHYKDANDHRNGILTNQMDWIKVPGMPRTAIFVCDTLIAMLLKHAHGFTNAA